MRVVYTKDENVVDKHLRSAWFEDLEEIGDAYKIECRKNKITINRPFQIGIVVYQLAKLRMLEFYYDFLDRYLDRRDFELIQMDTDSMYLALSTETLEEAVRPFLISKRSLKGRKRAGCLGTSGAAESPACSSLSVKAQEPSRCAASVTS